ncbi:STAS domain-containing protein [Micromonospora sp. NBC_01412]|uniref:STAS domain-containing protein n=1 Tax=Micromonospora sp. NBC_01412 TaxID=2903590 RepID=UPI003249EE4C
MPPEPTWHWRVDASTRRTVLALFGEIDMSGANRLDGLLHETIAQAGAVEVDLERVTFIDSIVLSTLVNAHHHAAGMGVDLVLVNAAGQVRRVLDMTGIMQLLGNPAGPSPAAT